MIDAIADFIPTQQVQKSNNSQKDKKQKSNSNKNKYRQEQISQIRKNGTIAIKQPPYFSLSSEVTERRSGDDRRNCDKTRGKWLESRLVHDRRRGLSIYLQI